MFCPLDLLYFVRWYGYYSFDRYLLFIHEEEFWDKFFQEMESVEDVEYSKVYDVSSYKSHYA